MPAEAGWQRQGGGHPQGRLPRGSWRRAHCRTRIKRLAHVIIYIYEMLTQNKLSNLSMETNALSYFDLHLFIMSISEKNLENKICPRACISRNLALHSSLKPTKWGFMFICRIWKASIAGGDITAGPGTHPRPDPPQRGPHVHAPLPG